MEVVTCYCKKCDAEVGRFRNSWIGIGNTYFSPSYPPLSVDGIQPTGEIYDAARDSQIQDSVLQDIACEKCEVIFGLRCDKAPEGHLLKPDQLILRLCDMFVLSDSSGKRAKILTFKSYPLTFAPGLRRTSGKVLPPLPSPQRSMPVSLIPPEAANTAVSPAQAAVINYPTIDLAKFKSWAEDAINDQKKDIERLTGSVNRLERDMSDFKQFMRETRAELASSSRIPLIEDNPAVRSLRDDLEQLREKVDQNGSLMTRGSLNIARTVDGLTADVHAISRKVDDVDPLKTQLASMQSKIVSLETMRNYMAISNAENSKLSGKTDDIEFLENQLADVLAKVDSLEANQSTVANSTLNLIRSSGQNDDICLLKSQLAEMQSKIYSIEANQKSMASDHEERERTNLSTRNDEMNLLKTQLTKIQSRMSSLEAMQNSKSINNEETNRTRLSALDKRKYTGGSEEYTIENVEFDESLPKRRKVSRAMSPPRSFHRRDPRTPIPKITEIPSSSGVDQSPGLSIQDNDTSGNLGDDSFDVPDTLPPVAAPEAQQEMAKINPRVRVEIRSSFPPSMMMPLQNGTLFDAGDRHDAFDVSHVEAATGQRRDRHDRWAPRTDRRSQSSSRRISGGKNKLNPVFSNGLVGNSINNGQDHGRRSSLRPRKASNNITSIAPYDGAASDDDSRTPHIEEDHEEETEIKDTNHSNSHKQKKDTKPKLPRMSFAGSPSMAAMARSERENTAPPVEWPSNEPFNKLALPQFFKCGTCNQSYRTLQALDYHHEHSGHCRKGARDVVPEGFKYESCQKLFKSFTGIREHMRKKVCTDPTPRRVSSGNIKCEACHKKFRDEGQLSDHLCFARAASAIPIAAITPAVQTGEGNSERSNT